MVLFSCIMGCLMLDMCASKTNEVFDVTFRFTCLFKFIHIAYKRNVKHYIFIDSPEM